MRENYASCFLQYNIHHPLTATPIDNASDSLSYGWCSSKATRIWGLIGGRSLYSSPRTASLTDFLSPLCPATPLICDCHWLEAAHQFLDIGSKWIWNDKWSGTRRWRRCKWRNVMEAKSITGHIVVRADWRVLRFIQVGVAKDWWDSPGFAVDLKEGWESSSSLRVKGNFV